MGPAFRFSMNQCYPKRDSPPVFSSRTHLPKPQRTRQQYTTEFLASQRERTTERSSPYPIEGTTPSCCIIPRASNSVHASTILPPSKRAMPMPVTVPCFPVGAIPMSCPLLVPRSYHLFTSIPPPPTPPPSAAAPTTLTSR